jgi:hypothetical protein
VTSNPRREPLFDVDPRTGATLEVFYADRALETFGRGGSCWFWWPRRRGFAPDGPPTGPFPTSYAAYRHALGTALGTKGHQAEESQIKPGGWRTVMAEREGLEPPTPRASEPSCLNTRWLHGSTRIAHHSGHHAALRRERKKYAAQKVTQK